MINYRTINRTLIDAVIKAYDRGNGSDTKNALRVLKTAMIAYKKKMLVNAKQNLGTSKNFRHTIDSVERKIKKHINAGKLSSKGLRIELRRQLNRLITNSRKYQRQVQKNTKLIKVIKRQPEKSKYHYVITHPITTTHSDECANDKANEPDGGYSKKQALEIMSRKPNHINCDCTVVLIRDNK